MENIKNLWKIMKMVFSKNLLHLIHDSFGWVRIDIDNIFNHTQMREVKYRSLKS